MGTEHGFSANVTLSYSPLQSLYVYDKESGCYLLNNVELSPLVIFPMKIIMTIMTTNL